MAYWQNGKCILHVSSQSQSFITPALAVMIGIPPTDLVVIAEYCGGGFGSKGGAYPLQALPALFSKKLKRPVMMRISRAESSTMARHVMDSRGNSNWGLQRTASCWLLTSTSCRRMAPTTASGISATPRMRCRCCTNRRRCAGGACRVYGNSPFRQRAARSGLQPDGAHHGAAAGQGSAPAQDRPPGHPAGSMHPRCMVCWGHSIRPSPVAT